MYEDEIYKLREIVELGSVCMNVEHQIGALQVLRNADGGGGCLIFLGKKRYEGVMFNVISVTRGGWGSNFQKKIALRNT